VFGGSRQRLAPFETKVEKSDGQTGYINLLWHGILLIRPHWFGKSLL
jgi:hypothetical protein